MSTTGITLDLRKFNAAIREYAAVSKKDSVTVVHRCLNNLAIKGITAQKEASKAIIAVLEKKEWWPKYVSRLLVKRNAARVAKKMAGAKTVKGAAKMQARFNARAFTKMEAKRFSKTIIHKRTVAVRYMKFFFASISKIFGPLSGQASKSAGKSFAGFQVKPTIATPSNLTAACTVSYEYRKRSAKTAAKATRLLGTALASAVTAAIADMRVYVEKKMADRGRQFSGARR